LQGEAAFELDILAKVKGNAVANHLFIESDGFFHVSNRQQRAFEFQHNSLSFDTAKIRKASHLLTRGSNFLSI
jgi:hypothetical protein